MEKSPLAEDGAPAENGEPSQIEVLGGKDVRSMSRTDEGVFASIEAPQRWYSVNRTQPTSFLYEFQNKPYSDLIARSPHCEITAVDRGGRPHVRVYFHHPDFYPLDSSSFVLLFDPDDLLVERDCIVKLLRDRAPRVYEKHTFSDYRACGDSSGEQIRFPYRAVYHYYAGDLPDGSHVEYTAEDIRIVEIKFNVPIPDDRFALEFPKDARVYDEVSGVGWLDEAAKRAGSAAELTRPVGRTRWVLILVTTLLVLLVAVLLWRDRRRAQ